MLADLSLHSQWVCRHGSCFCLLPMLCDLSESLLTPISPCKSRTVLPQSPPHYLFLLCGIQVYCYISGYKESRTGIENTRPWNAQRQMGPLCHTLPGKAWGPSWKKKGPDFKDRGKIMTFGRDRAVTLMNSQSLVVCTKPLQEQANQHWSKLQQLISWKIIIDLV